MVKDGYSECDIIERAESMFTSGMEPVSGDLTVYYDGFYEDGFGRPQVENEYANVIFFFVQYAIIVAFAWTLLKPVKRI